MTVTMLTAGAARVNRPDNAEIGMPKDKHFQMRVSQDFLDLVDEWRRREPDIPPRAEAIRRLVLKGAMSYETISDQAVSLLFRLHEEGRVTSSEMAPVNAEVEAQAQWAEHLLKITGLVPNAPPSDK